MPNKHNDAHNDARHHHIPKMTFKVTNWSAYGSAYVIFTRFGGHRC
jgi:hypothetical protein